MFQSDVKNDVFICFLGGWINLPKLACSFVYLRVSLQKLNVFLDKIKLFQGLGWVFLDEDGCPKEGICPWATKLILEEFWAYD